MKTREFSTRAAIMKMVNDFTSREGGFFNQRNSTIANKLGVSQKTVANNISVLLKDQVLTKTYIQNEYGKDVRYLKTISNKFLNIQETVKNFYIDQGTVTRTPKGKESGTYNTSIKESYDTNNNTLHKVNDSKLVSELKSKLTDFRGSIEKYVCSVNNDNLLINTLKTFNVTSGMQSISAVFKNIVNEKLSRIEELNEIKKIEAEKLEAEQKQVDIEFELISSWYNELDSQDKDIINQHIDLSSVLSSDGILFDKLKVTSKKQIIADLEPIFNDFESIKEYTDKSISLREWYTSQDSTRKNYIKYLVSSNTGFDISIIEKTILSGHTLSKLKTIFNYEKNEWSLKDEFEQHIAEKESVIIEKQKEAAKRAGELNIIYNNFVKSEYVFPEHKISDFKDKEKTLTWINSLHLDLRKYIINEMIYSHSIEYLNNICDINKNFEILDVIDPYKLSILFTTEIKKVHIKCTKYSECL